VAPEKYICDVCRQDFLTEELKRTCESRPVEEPADMPFGTVFTREDGLFGILYDEQRIERQTHRRRYEIARTGVIIQYKDYWDVWPLDVVHKDVLDNAQPISEKDFNKAVESLRVMLSRWDGSAQKRIGPLPWHIDRLMGLLNGQNRLIPYTGR